MEVRYERADDGASILLQFKNGAQGVIVASAALYEDSPFGQTHHKEFHGSEGTLYTLNDWDKVQEVRGARVGEGMPKPLPIPDEIWGNARRDSVHNTYRDVFRQQDHMARAWIRRHPSGYRFFSFIYRCRLCSKDHCGLSAQRQRRTPCAD